MHYLTRRTLSVIWVIVVGLIPLAVFGLARAGNDGGSNLDFSGSAYVVVTETTSVSDLGLLPSGFTLEAWIFPRTVVTTTGTHRFSIVRNNNDYNLYIDSSGHLAVEVFPGGNATNGFIRETADSVLSAGQWYHVAAVSDTLGVRLYVNGAPLTSTPFADVYAGPEQLWIGSDHDAPSQGFDGYIDEVRIWSTARTAAEIQSAMFQQTDWG